MSNLSSLIYVPVLHTKKDASEIIASLMGQENGEEKNSGISPLEQEKALNEMWDGIQQKIEEAGLSYKTLRIYQDALPVCGRENEIVEKLAEKGSRNHQLIWELAKRGASIEGTEDPSLLVKEYEYLTSLLNAVSLDSQNRREIFKEYEDKSVELIKKRDIFIAARIRGTIKDSEIPLVFMGIKHKLKKLFQPYFAINYIIYRLPFKNVEDIYNV